MRPFMSRTFASVAIVAFGLGCDGPDDPRVESVGGALSDDDAVDDASASPTNDAVSPALGPDAMADADGLNRPAPSPDNLDDPEQINAAYRALLAGNPELRAQLESLRASPDAAGPAIRLTPREAPDRSDLRCAHDIKTATPPPPSAAPGATDVVPARYHSEVSARMRAAGRPARDKVDLDALSPLVGRDLRWVESTSP